MSILSFKKRKMSGHTSDLDVQEISAHMQGGALFSMESSVAVEAMKSGKIEALDLGAIAQGLKGVLEPSNESATYQNPTGMLAAAFISAFAQKPADYARLSFESSIAPLKDGISMAALEGREYDTGYSAESFDNQNLLDNLSISIGLNYKIARQGPAMELIYRTVALTPDQGGVDVLIPNLYVENLVRHAQDGSPSDFGFRRVIDSAIDYTVLNDNSTALLPTYNDTTKANFVAEAVVAPYTLTEGRRSVTTSALVVQKQVNLFGLGQIDTVARSGQPDYTEAVDRNIGVAGVFLNLGAATLFFDTKGLPYSRWVKAPEQNARGLKLAFDLSSLFIDGTTLDYQGHALPTGGIWDTIKTGGYKVRLKTTINGAADVERGTISVNPSLIEVMSITNAAGEAIALDGVAGKAVVDGLVNLAVVGWTIDARVTNTNHRHLGLMLNVRPVGERLLTRTRAPMFVPYPLGEERDQTVMDWLTFAVSSYINNEAVGTLIAYHERLMRLTSGIRGDLTKGDFEINSLPIEGVARHLINPYIEELNVDLLANAQSQETVANVDNGTEVLVNTIRSVCFDILQKTNYENACRFVDGGEQTTKWKFALVTSPKIKRFMSITGDSRTLGAELSYQLESDVDARLENVMYLTLVRDVEGIDVLSSGVMLLTPTLVSTIAPTRDNAPRNEAVVQPRFQHYNLLPIMVKINVTGVDELLEETLPFRVVGHVL